MPDLFPSLVYLLCFVTSAACSYLLLRSYGRSQARLLLWSGICFLFLTANNLAVMVDLLVVRGLDLSIFRILVSLAAVVVLLFGLIIEREERP